MIFDDDWTNDIELDRSITLPEIPTGMSIQSHVDECVLKALLAAPLISDYALVERKPTVAEMASIAESTTTHTPLLSDDCYVMCGQDEQIDQIVTISQIHDGRHRHYLLSAHLLRIGALGALGLVAFKTAANHYSVIDFPDKNLMDEYGLTPSGKGLWKYIESPQRQRPAFIMRNSPLLSARDKQYLRMTKMLLDPIGPAIANDKIYKEANATIGGMMVEARTDIIIFHPGNTVGVLYDDGHGGIPDGFVEEIAECPLLSPQGLRGDYKAIGNSSKQFWSPVPTIRKLLSDDEIKKRGEKLQRIWNAHVRKLDRIYNPQETFTAKPDETTIQPEATFTTENIEEPLQQTKEIALSEEGWPITIDDVPPWIENTFGTSVIMMPRASKALIKSAHPDPTRLAKAIDLLARYKIEIHRGNRHLAEEYETQLKHLRMNDGFSNAERLRGMTGDNYLVRINGRRLLLDRHLCSNSSGYNDPRLIRIYYCYDRESDRIVIGWMPTHLPTSKS